MFTFEDAEMYDEPETDSEVLPQGVGYGEVLGYRQAATLLYDDEITQAEKREALRVLEQLWDKGFTSATYHLGVAIQTQLGYCVLLQRTLLYLRHLKTQRTHFKKLSRKITYLGESAR